ncbi:MAG: amidohydrolase family protein [Terricaulis sp.]
MKRLWAVAALAFVAALLPSARAQTPAAQLAQAPANAETWNIVSTAGQHGTSKRWVAADGTHWSRESILLRGFVTEIDQQQKFAADGTLQSLVIRGVTPNGDAAEMFSAANGQYSYQSPVDHGDAVYPAHAYYSSVGGAFDGAIAFVDALRAAPNHSLQLLPSGQASLEQLTTKEVSNGHETKTLTCYIVVGTGLSPFPVWYDGDHFFAFAGFLSWVKPGWESVVPALSETQSTAMSERASVLVNQIGPHLTHPVLFQDVKLFDSINRRFVDHQSVLVNNGVITAVGAARSVHTPADAQIIAGNGQTLLPGLWDSHQHYGGDESGPLLLAQGITSIRDPGNIPSESTARRHRIENGQLLGPRIVPSLLIDGAGPNTAQMATVAHNVQEAVAAVDRAHEDGYFGIKIYGSVDPSWVAPMAAEAHKLHMHVHGHIPAGMRPLDAIRAGYDEITHINFVMMQAMPDDVVAHSNGIARHMGMAQYAPDVDLRGPQMTAILNEMQQKHIAVDPTLVTFEQEYVPDSGDVSAAYAAFLGTMPPQVERGFRSGGLPPTAEVTRARMRAAQAALSNLVGELHRRHITIVAGTDGSGLELVRELELYVHAGFTPADAIASATIVPSQLFGVGDQAGSITVGKKAELFLVNGDPSANVGDLRLVTTVMRDNRLMQADALRHAIGISGPPHRVVQ